MTNNFNNNLFSILTTFFDYSIYGLSFFFPKFISRNDDQSMSQSNFVESSTMAVVAITTKFMVESKIIDSYGYSYIPIIFSWTFKNSPFESNTAKIVASSGALAATKIIYDNNLWTYFLSPTVTYLACSINKTPLNYIWLYTLVSLVEDIVITSELIQNYNKHWITFINIGLSTSSRINYFNPIIQNIIGLGLGIIGTAYEEPIRKYLFPKDTFEDSYKAIYNIVKSKSEFNKLLEHTIILTTNIHYSIGLLGNHLVSEENIKNSKLALLSQTNPEDNLRLQTFLDFKKTAFSYATIIVPYYIFSKITTEALNKYLYDNILYIVEQDFIHSTIIEKNNFLDISRYSKLAIKDYLNNIETIILENQNMLGEIALSIAKLSSIGKLNNLSGWQIPIIMTIDGFISSFFEYIESQKQYYLIQATNCAAKFDKISQYDIVNSNSLLQSDQIDNLHQKWNQSYICKFHNERNVKILQPIINVLQDNYSRDVLFTFFQYLSAHLFKNNFIDKKDIFLFARVLQTTTNCLLFKTKHESNFERINRAIDSLDELYKIIQSNNSNLGNIKISFNQQNGLYIEDLNFERGDFERKISIKAKNLHLEKEKTYLFIDANGVGKSSFLSLLYFRLNSIKDNSFFNTSGHISYPSSKIKMISQKDYCPLNSTLLDLVITRTKVQDLSKNEQDQLVHKTLSLYQNLNFTGSRKKLELDDLFEYKENWCSELSGGQVKKLFIISSIITCPDLLILDEALDPLDFNSKKISYNLLKNNDCTNKATIISTSHDNFYSADSNIKNDFFDSFLCIRNETIALCEIQNIYDDA